MYWFLLASVALLAIAGFLMVSDLRDLERRARDIDDQNRRAHVRLDNHQRQINAIAKDLGWSDDRARTQMMPPSKSTPTK